MKKIMNDPAAVADEFLLGFTQAHHTHVHPDTEYRLCLRNDGGGTGRVALVSGGGSGHEPLHAGFVGEGLLDAAVLGEVFASPSSEQIVQAGLAAHRGAGVLLVVKNYTGDVLNFRVAAEVLEDEGIETATVIVDDDAALSEKAGGPGRRGTGATVFVEKIAGAKAASGASLAEVAGIARRAVQASRSIGVALTSCVTPMAGRATFDLGHDEIEFGVGIHGERGVRSQPIATADELAHQMIDVVATALALESGARLLVLTNGLGGTPESELFILHGSVLRHLREAGLHPERQVVGNYVTSLDMAGASLSLLVLDDELLELWDAPASAPAWRGSGA